MGRMEDRNKNAGGKEEGKKRQERRGRQSSKSKECKPKGKAWEGRTEKYSKEIRTKKERRGKGDINKERKTERRSEQGV